MGNRVFDFDVYFFREKSHSEKRACFSGTYNNNNIMSLTELFKLVCNLILNAILICWFMLIPNNFSILVELLN